MTAAKFIADFLDSSILLRKRGVHMDLGTLQLIIQT